MTGFIVGAGVLVILVLAVLLRPLLKRVPHDTSQDRVTINARIYRNHLTELENDRANGILTPAGYEQSRQELENRALEDLREETSPATASSRWPGVALAIAVPVAAIVTYIALGTPGAMLRADAENIDVERIHRMVADLAQRLERNPGDLRGWVMLGRSYKAMGRLPESIQAFERAGEALDEDPQNLIDFAEAIALTDKDNFQKRGVALIERALKINPDHLPALVFAGSAAYERNDYRSAERYWKKVLDKLPPESNEAKAVQEAISRATEAKGASKSAAKAASKQAGPARDEKRSATAPDTVRGVVTLAAGLQGKAGADDTVFIFARAATGPRAPLAVLRARVRDLPLEFMLDDKLAMSPDLQISRFSEVRVEARISRSGNATPASGDLQGATGVVKVGSNDLRIEINQQIP